MRVLYAARTKKPIPRTPGDRINEEADKAREAEKAKAAPSTVERQPASKADPEKPKEQAKASDPAKGSGDKAVKPPQS